MSAPVPNLESGEMLLRRIPASPRAFWRDHAVMAVVGGIGAALVLALLGRGDVWVGPVAAVLAIGGRGAWLASESLAAEWHLTDRRLIGPGGRTVRLGEVAVVRRLLGDVQIVTAGGDKHLIKHVADGTAVADAIRSARDDGTPRR